MVPHNKIKWHLDELVFIKKNFSTMSAKQLLHHINSNRGQNEPKIRLHSLRLKYYSLGLYKNPRNIPWNQREARYLVNNYQKMGNLEMCKHLNSHASRSRNFTVKTIWKKMKLMRLHRSPAELLKIKKNHIGESAWIEAHKITAAKKTYPDGKKVVRIISGLKYWYVKQGSKMVAYHRLVWERKNGSIPEGYKIYFKDGNGLNCSPDNLECKKGHMRRRKLCIAPINESFLLDQKTNPSRLYPQQFHSTAI